MTNIEILLKQISKIVVKEKIQQEEKRKRGENFNIFDVLGLSTNEVRLHSAFLAELLKPNGDHGLGDKFLDSFIKQVIKKVDPNFVIDTRSCKVYVEYPIGEISEDYSEGGRIDLLIQDKNNHAIVIENKINAGDQYKQLLRYHNWATKNSQKYVLIYLTKNRTEAKEYSAENIDYKRIGYKDEILPWLQNCIGIAALFPRVRETLTQYITNLKQITNIMNDDNKTELINLLVNEANIESTLSIYHIQDEVTQKIRKDFIEKRLRQLAEKHGVLLKFDEGFLNLPSGENGYNTIRFINKEYPGYFQIEQERNVVYYGIVTDGYRDEEKIELQQFDDWYDGKSKKWTYGSKYFPGNLRWWDSKDALIDMVKGNQLINIIDEELTRIEDNRLIENLDRKIREL